MQNKPEVIIVGAGPTGLTLACDLARRGVRFRIFDKSEQAFCGSRAKGVQPRTQEVLDDLGVIGALKSVGAPYPPMCAHLWKFRFRWHMQKVTDVTPDVPYPNILLVPQWQTEKVLGDELELSGHRVERGLEIIALDQDSEQVSIQLRGKNVIEKVSARYLVAADGGRSFVRKALDVGFEGFSREEGRMIVGDVRVEGLSRDAWHVWPKAKGGLIGLCPLPHTDLFQLMMRLKPGDEPELSEEEVQKRWLVGTRLKSVRLHSPTWLSVFRPNVRMVKKYRVGRVFLAGDAAHVHTPAGAQGLNTGVQDAYNLGWKLAMSLRGAPDTLLDSYEEERLPVAAAVLQISTKLYGADKKRSIPKMKRGDAERQLALNYRGSSLAMGNGSEPGVLQAGDRAPDAPCEGQSGKLRFFDVFRGPHFTLLAFGEKAAVAIKQIELPTPEILRSFAVLHTGPALDRSMLIDTSGSAHTIYGVGDQGETIVLVRPDGYIGLIARRDWKQALADYFNNLIGIGTSDKDTLQESSMEISLDQ
ncbi:FAD-dependent oxidoreductase [Microbulbifer elongatus]|uniref:FAD-dependent oxidoreductase n=1 Tax=Microbulbifer elongatus TaxID=86173 RepID=UPI001CFE6019|nr:FAD-dependent oxidoreductase [Microbulbifer elongatus]